MTVRRALAHALVVRARAFLVSMMIVACGSRAPESSTASAPPTTTTVATPPRPHATLDTSFAAPFAPPPPPSSAPWTAPEGVDARWTAAITDLYAHGFPDVRGLAYRNVTVEGLSVWGHQGAHEQPMFVIPGEPASAVGWDGVVRAVSHVGEPADLDAAIAEQLAQSDFLGRAQLARLGRVSPYLTMDPGSLVDVWIDALSDFALNAYVGADDAACQQALAVLERLAPLPSDAPIVIGGTARELQPALVSEMRRRRARGHTLQVPDEETTDLSDQPIDVLVEALADVRATQRSQPGGVDFSDSAIVRELIARGDAAFDALLETVAHEEGLTRSVEFWRDFAPDRSIVSERWVAWIVIGEILGWSPQMPICVGCRITASTPEENVRVAEALRAYHTRIAGMSRAERLFDLLAEDAGDLSTWEPAAAALVGRDDVDPRTERSVDPRPWSCPFEGTMLGASLRARTGPSVSETIARRIEHTMADPSRAFGASSCSLARSLTIWDPHAEVLGRFGTQCLAAGSRCACLLAAVEAALPRDAAPLDALAAERVAHPQTTTPGDIWLLAAHRDHPAADAALQVLLAVDSPVWERLELDQAPNYYHHLNARWLEVAEVRARILRRLSDTRETATLVVDADSRADVQWSRGSFQLETRAGRSPGMTPVRECDLWAYGLDHSELGLPTFDIEGTLADRHAALATIRTRITEWPARDRCAP